MINEKNKFLTVSWLSGLLSAEIFISTGEWGVQMPPLTSENSHFLRSGPQGSTLVMWYFIAWARLQWRPAASCFCWRTLTCGSGRWWASVAWLFKELTCNNDINMQSLLFCSHRQPNVAPITGGKWRWHTFRWWLCGDGAGGDGRYIDCFNLPLSWDNVQT